MIALVALAVIAAFVWVAVAKFARSADGWLALDAYRPSAADVADLENSLPHIPGDPHFVINASDIEYLEAVARYRESGRSDGEVS